MISASPCFSIECDFEYFPTRSGSLADEHCKTANEWRQSILKTNISDFIRFEPPEAQEHISYQIRDNIFGVRDLIFGNNNSFKSKLINTENILIKYIRHDGINICYINNIEPKSFCMYWFKLGPYMWYIGTDYLEAENIG